MNRSSSPFLFTGQATRVTFFLGQLRSRRSYSLCLPIAAFTVSHQPLCSAARFGIPVSLVCITLSVPVNDIPTGDIPFSLATRGNTQRTTKIRRALASPVGGSVPAPASRGPPGPTRSPGIRPPVPIDDGRDRPARPPAVEQARQQSRGVYLALLGGVGVGDDPHADAAGLLELFAPGVRPTTGNCRRGGSDRRRTRGRTARGGADPSRLPQGGSSGSQGRPAAATPPGRGATGWP